MGIKTDAKMTGQEVRYLPTPSMLFLDNHITIPKYQWLGTMFYIGILYGE